MSSPTKRPFNVFSMVRDSTHYTLQPYTPIKIKKEKASPPSRRRKLNAERKEQPHQMYAHFPSSTMVQLLLVPHVRYQCLCLEPTKTPLALDRHRSCDPDTLSLHEIAFAGTKFPLPFAALTDVAVPHRCETEFQICFRGLFDGWLPQVPLRGTLTLYCTLPIEIPKVKSVGNFDQAFPIVEFFLNKKVYVQSASVEVTAFAKDGNLVIPFSVRVSQGPTLNIFADFSPEKGGLQTHLSHVLERSQSGHLPDYELNAHIERHCKLGNSSLTGHMSCRLYTKEN